MLYCPGNDNALFGCLIESSNRSDKEGLQATINHKLCHSFRCSIPYTLNVDFFFSFLILFQESIENPMYAAELSIVTQPSEATTPLKSDATPVNTEPDKVIYAYFIALEIALLCMVV